MLRAKTARVISLVLVALAAFVVVQAVLTTLHPPTVGALVATRDLAPGDRVTAEDVRVLQKPEVVVGQSTLTSVDQAASRVVIGHIAAGEVLTQGRFVGSAPGAAGSAGAAGAAGSAGRVTLHVPIADELTLTWLQPGDVVDLLALDSGDVVAQEALILAIDPSRDQGSLGIAGGAVGGSGRGLLVSVSAAQSGPLAKAAGSATGVAAATKTPGE